jgi:hypothetical protein
MVTFTSLAVLTLFVTSGFAAPTTESLSIWRTDSNKTLCNLRGLKTIFCPHRRQDNLKVKTALGFAQGVKDPSGADRFIVKYADSQRWKPSTLVSSWNLPYV